MVKKKKSRYIYNDNVDGYDYDPEVMSFYTVSSASQAPTRGS